MSKLLENAVTQMFKDEARILELEAEVARLQDKCNKQALVLQRLTPEAFPGILFIHGEMGEKDANGLPEKLLVVPSYGCDWSQVYVKSERISGPEW